MAPVPVDMTRYVKGCGCLFSSLFAVAGVVVVLFGIAGSQQSSHLKAVGRTTTATISDCLNAVPSNAPSWSTSNTSCSANYSVNGRTYSIEETGITSGNPTIVYDPSNPSDAVLLQNLNGYWGLIVFGIVFVLFGIFFGGILRFAKIRGPVHTSPFVSG